MWADVEMTIPRTTEYIEIYTFNVTIFLAIGNPPDAGLNGTLSVCLTPSSDDWDRLSVLTQLQNTYNLPTVFVSFEFYESNNLYFGIITFADTNDDV